MKISITIIIICISIISPVFNLKKQYKTNQQFLIGQPIKFSLWRKDSIDKLVKRAIRTKSKNLKVLVKVKGKNKLVKVEGTNWPENIEYTYNLIEDTVNNCTFILATPFSESGDWDVTYAYYFDRGKLFAFERKTGFFNSECTDDAAHETICYFYNNDFKQVKKTYKLTDRNGKNLVKSKCVFNYDFKDYKIYKTLDDCLKGYKIDRQLLFLH